ncbi:tetraprenyl-beta-curcumene synthase family protein [Ammoniphilus sp. 3BR4]|uniref:tetraprenyl-beta-curcumene synthase family protein n=1 Tax=Ammoniphilus sp. 3BR4 TaxID=3158265 RepID=UPI0034673F91
MHPKGSLHLMYILYRQIFPQVRVELKKWHDRALLIPDAELRKQALDSIQNKTFHCEGGCVYAAANLSMKDTLIPLIVAYQTISDYLDNLCDRSTSCQPSNFACLHLAMYDAVTLQSGERDYYVHNHEKDDGGYLRELVQTCQRAIRQLPHYEYIQESVQTLTSLYCDLQTHKHAKEAERETRLLAWWEEHKSLAPELGWHEFSAATGSTLGVFHLFQAASLPLFTKERVDKILQAYFPWICALHILLDYLIDLEEDQIGGDLNFIAYYQTQKDIYERIQFISSKAKWTVRRLPDASFHQMIVDGLLGLYLSDGKVQRQPMVKSIGQKLIRSSALRTRFFYWNSRVYRGSKAILQPPPAHR